MKCDRCEKEFSPDEDPGGLFFGQPVSDTPGIKGRSCKKYHLCQVCTRQVTSFIILPRSWAPVAATALAPNVVGWLCRNPSRTGRKCSAEDRDSNHKRLFGCGYD